MFVVGSGGIVSSDRFAIWGFLHIPSERCINQNQGACSPNVSSSTGSFAIGRLLMPGFSMCSSCDSAPLWRKIALIPAFSQHLRCSEPFDWRTARSFAHQYANKRTILTLLHFFGGTCKNPIMDEPFLTGSTIHITLTLLQVGQAAQHRPGRSLQRSELLHPR